MKTINHHSDIPDSIRYADTNETIHVRTDTLREFAEIAAGPDRLCRPDLTFIVRSGE